MAHLNVTRYCDKHNVMVITCQPKYILPLNSPRNVNYLPHNSHKIILELTLNPFRIARRFPQDINKNLRILVRFPLYFQTIFFTVLHSISTCFSQVFHCIVTESTGYSQEAQDFRLINPTGIPESSLEYQNPD